MPSLLPSRPFLTRASRDKQLLVRSAALIGLAGLIVAAITDSLRDKRAGRPEIGEIEMIERLEELGSSLAGLEEEERTSELVQTAEIRIYQLILQWEVGEELTHVYSDFIQLCRNLPADRDALVEMELWHTMLSHCETPDALGHAPRLAAEVAFFAGLSDEAIKILDAGYERTGVALLLRRAVAAAVRANDLQFLRHTLEDPERLRQLDVWTRCDVAVKLRAYGELFRSVLVMDLQGLRPGLFILSLLAVAVWLSILLQFSSAWQHWFLVSAAMFLGVCSAFLTLYVVFLQEHIRGFVPNGDLGHDLLYWIAGVGLREEAIKVICFLPCLPWLVRQGSPLLALITAATVGLGFALQENAIYFLAGGSSVTWGRFLTATFLHASLTGIAGYSLYTLFFPARRNWENALVDMLSVVIAHGMYDAFLGVRQLADSSVLSLVFIAYLAYRFFGLIHELREPSRITVSPLGIFVLGGALVIAAALNFSLWDAPFKAGVSSFGLEVVGIAPVAFLFIRQFKEI